MNVKEVNSNTVTTTSISAHILFLVKHLKHPDYNQILFEHFRSRSNPVVVRSTDVDFRFLDFRRKHDHFASRPDGSDDLVSLRASPTFGLDLWRTADRTANVHLRAARSNGNFARIRGRTRSVIPVSESVHFWSNPYPTTTTFVRNIRRPSTSTTAATTVFLNIRSTSNNDGRSVAVCNTNSFRQRRSCIWSSGFRQTGWKSFRKSERGRDGKRVWSATDGRWRRSFRRSDRTSARLEHLHSDGEVGQRTFRHLPKRKIRTREDPRVAATSGIVRLNYACHLSIFKKKKNENEIYFGI